ncbi:hypothetical protein MMC07_009152 [Pseudocyphellaria aurata]|nr:hypothetical protein [Pseudocyphellaria aurata]
MSHFFRRVFGPSPKQPRDDEESASRVGEDSPLIVDNASAAPDVKPSYGSTSVEVIVSNDSVQDKEEITKRSEEEVKKLTGIAYVRRFAIFIPYIWPSNNRWLQLNMIGVVVCLAMLRVVRILAPLQLGRVINVLGTSPAAVLLRELLLYLLFNWVDTAGLIEMLKAYLWIPVEQNAHKALAMAAYTQVMTLSSDFHDNKKSGELYKSIEQGTAIHYLFETVFFDVTPMMFDLVIAAVYLSYLFGWYMCLVVCSLSVSFVWAAKYVTELQVSIMRENAETSRAENQVLYDSVGSWISVTYFNNWRYEQKRYLDAMTKSLASTRAMTLLMYMGSICKSFVLEIGYSAACALAGYQVFKGERAVGDFVMLLNYWSRFTGPLGFFGYIQRNLQQNFVEAEQMLELLETEPTVKDGAAEFHLGEGAIEFEKVDFSYDGTKPIINDLDFSALPGQKVALVGETGCGKSTILKLLFRLYDVGSGSIRIDGQDIRDVTLESLRSCIGVVPQNPVLFNDTVMNNVRYSRLGATDEQVVEACKAAAIHDKILSFTDGYASLVGENGVKLSGGEVQRIAIARAILMDSRIIMLDEATSAVDSHTEAQIQTALRRLTNGRTTFCVAHRLSTVMDADVMLVIKEGRIAEQGPPTELLKRRGHFFDLCVLQNITTE